MNDLNDHLISGTPEYDAEHDWRISALSKLNGSPGQHPKRDRQTAHCFKRKETPQ